MWNCVGLADSSAATRIPAGADIRAVVGLRRPRFPHRCVTRRTQNALRDRRNVERGRLPPAKASPPLHDAYAELLSARSWRSHRPVAAERDQRVSSAQARGGWRSWLPSSRCRSPRFIVGSASAGSRPAKWRRRAAVGRSTPTPMRCSVSVAFARPRAAGQSPTPRN